MNAAFPRAVLTHGIGRYVCQLQRVTLKFCKHNGASRGMREFLEHDLIKYAKDNPGIVVYVKPRRHREPVISAEYLNGEKQWIGCRNFSRDEVCKWLELVRTQTKDTSDLRMRKMWHTEFPSIQGPWTPFFHWNKEQNIMELPNDAMSRVPQGETATEQVLKIFKEQQRLKAEREEEAKHTN